MRILTTSIIGFLLTSALLLYSPCEAKDTPSFGECSSALETGSAAENPDIVAMLEAWARDNAVAVPQETRDRFVSEYLCVETKLQAARSVPSDELREVGLEVARGYLDGFLQGDSGSLAVTFSRRLGLGGIGSPKPRQYRQLIIETSPSDAEAVVDKTDIPSKKCLVTVGPHWLTAHRDGYESCRRRIRVREGSKPVTERCELRPGRSSQD